MRSKVQLTGGYCEATIKSDYKINQRVKFKEGIKHPLYFDDSYLIKDIRFNETTKEFEYLLETTDFSRFWKNQEDLQKLTENFNKKNNTEENAFYNTFITMNDYSNYKPFEFVTTKTSISSGLESLSSFYIDKDLKEFNFDFFNIGNNYINSLSGVSELDYKDFTDEYLLYNKEGEDSDG